MKNFSSTPHSRVAITIVLAVLGIAVTAAAGFRVVRYAMTRFGDNFFYPYTRITAPADRLSDTTLLLENKGALAAKVEKLSKVNAELTLRSQAMQDLLLENRKLRSHLNLRQRINQRYVTGEIILRDPLNFSNGFTIDRGSRDGVVSGAAVVDIDPDGNLLLIGVISQVNYRTSKVTAIIDPALRFSARVTSNDQIGFINSGDRTVTDGNIGIAMLPPRKDYINGALVITTGFEHGIPEGIKIGELNTRNVSRTYEQEDFQCEVSPAVKFESLRFVAVAIIIPQNREL